MSMIGVRAIALACLTLSLSGEAQTFTPFTCAACPTMTELDWRWDSTDMPEDPNCEPTATCPHYINVIDHTRYITANTKVKRIEFRTNRIDTETRYDWLDYRERGATSGTRLTGSPATGWQGVTLSQNASTTPLALRFYTDSTITRPGFLIDRARVCCGKTTGILEQELGNMNRTTGLLLGANDVVYYSYPVNTTSQQTLNVALWAEPGRDFDLYARCNAYPTPTTFRSSYCCARTGSDFVFPLGVPSTHPPLRGSSAQIRGQFPRSSPSSRNTPRIFRR